MARMARGIGSTNGATAHLIAVCVIAPAVIAAIAVVPVIFLGSMALR
jgi:asparagine N-glycosylation enzyme membrane subunit Stt3